MRLSHEGGAALTSEPEIFRKGAAKKRRLTNRGVEDFRRDTRAGSFRHSTDGARKLSIESSGRTESCVS